MPRYCGKVGFAEMVESSPGVWVEHIVEKKYYGDVLRAANNISVPQNTTNSAVSLNNRLSIICDAYMNLNFNTMRYATFMGSKWSITSVEVAYPRVTLTLGGLYNPNE